MAARPKKPVAGRAESPAPPAPSPAPMVFPPASMPDQATLMLVAALQQQVVQLDARLRAVELEQATRGASPPAPAAPVIDTSDLPPLEAHRAKERASILAALESTRWNRKEVSKMLGLPRRTLYRRMAEYGIQDGDSRTGATKRAKKKG